MPECFCGLVSLEPVRDKHSCCRHRGLRDDFNDRFVVRLTQIRRRQNKLSTATLTGLACQRAAPVKPSRQYDPFKTSVANFRSKVSNPSRNFA
jgi:hypothetical protein